MRKLEAGLFISLDGVVEAPNLWQFEFDADMGAIMTELISAEDTILLGRITYEEWLPYWPNESDEFANHINSKPKYVVSTTLDTVEWGNLEKPKLIKGNLVEEVNKLKKQSGKNIGVNGSPSLVRSLIQVNLLDELALLVHPVIAGKGKRLFENDSDLKKLKLVNSKPTSSGVVYLKYEIVKE